MSEGGRKGGREERRGEERRAMVLLCPLLLSLTPLGFSWTAITHGAPVDPHLQFAPPCVSACVT